MISLVPENVQLFSIKTGLKFFFNMTIIVIFIMPVHAMREEFDLRDMQLLLISAKWLAKVSTFNKTSDMEVHMNTA